MKPVVQMQGEYFANSKLCMTTLNVLKYKSFKLCVTILNTFKYNCFDLLCYALFLIIFTCNEITKPF